MLHKIQNSFQLNHIIKIMKELNEKGKEFTVEISQKNTATRQQQKYYFGVIINCIVEWNEESGVFTEEDSTIPIRDKDVIDDILRQKFYYKRVCVGDKAIKVKKTLNLSKSNRHEVITYFDTVIDYMSERGCFIPLPDEDNNWYYEDKNWIPENE